ncbi:GDP-L-fucose synthase [Glaciihabitans sp. dw_435]|uniref:GDP-L-fucose synthase family protein n=1 Tax=Glaciihabitans sp. dw_435 TaxID=2720081 RepID=UPI0027DDDF6A|nr:GDP-L-fucose synthase [Glaciihabitans sp. dw_435]
MGVTARMKVLVTGATGVIGMAVQENLTRNGYEVVGLRSTDCDLRNQADTVALLEHIKPDYVIHLAARVHGLMGNLRSQGSMYFDNVQINTNLVEAARLSGVKKIVAMGSVAMYSDTVSLPMRETDIWNGPPHGSEFGYASAKRAMLAQLESYRDQYELEYALALSTNLFGPNDRFDEKNGHVLPSLISKTYRGKTEGTGLVVWGSGLATRDFLYSLDAAEALRTLLESGSGTYNMASGSHVSIRETVDALVKISGFTGDIEWDRSKPDGQVERSYDISRLTDLGWSPKVKFEDALHKTYDWYAAHSEDARR